MRPPAHPMRLRRGRLARTAGWQIREQQGLLEEFVSGSDRDGLAEPESECVEIGAADDALALCIRDGEPPSLEHREDVGGLLSSAPLVEGTLLSLADEFFDDFFCFREHFESLSSGVAERGLDEDEI